MTLWRRESTKRGKEARACVCVCKVVFIYIVEVRDRMLMLAASRLSMMALGSEDRAVGSVGGNTKGRREGADIKDKKRDCYKLFTVAFCRK